MSIVGVVCEIYLKSLPLAFRKYCLWPPRSLAELSASFNLSVLDCFAVITKFFYLIRD
jgi:hypothetical protein